MALELTGSELKQPTPEEVKRYLENMQNQQFHLQAGVGWARIVAENKVIREVRPASVIVPPAVLIKWAATLLTMPYVLIQEIPPGLTVPPGKG